MSHDVKWIDGGDHKDYPGGIALRNAEDAKQILLETARQICPDRPPGDFNSRARVLTQAITILTAAVLRSGASATADGSASVEEIAMSSAYATHMLCQAVADLLTQDVEILVSDRLNPEFSSN
jgi:hypothetical protein